MESTHRLSFSYYSLSTALLPSSRSRRWLTFSFAFPTFSINLLETAESRSAMDFRLWENLWAWRRKTQFESHVNDASRILFVVSTTMPPSLHRLSHFPRFRALHSQSSTFSSLLRIRIPDSVSDLIANNFTVNGSFTCTFIRVHCVIICHFFVSWSSLWGGFVSTQCNSCMGGSLCLSSRLFLYWLYRWACELGFHWAAHWPNLWFSLLYDPCQFCCQSTWLNQNLYVGFWLFQLSWIISSYIELQNMVLEVVLWRLSCCLGIYSRPCRHDFHWFAAMLLSCIQWFGSFISDEDWVRVLLVLGRDLFLEGFI